MSISNTRRALHRVKDRMREGWLLANMNTVHGKRWFLVPRGRTKTPGREVSEEIAWLLIREADVFPRRDGLWAGLDQTYGLGDGDEQECTAK